MATGKAYAAMESGAAFLDFEYEMPSLKADEVEIKVESCGICHSDLSMLKNDWGMTGLIWKPINWLNDRREC